MNSNQSIFEEIVRRFTAAVESNDGEELASLFKPDGIYDDGFYGEFKGRKAIADMLTKHFWGNAEDFQWQMSNLCTDGKHAYTTYLFRYRSIMPESKGQIVWFNGMSHYLLDNGLIERYEEVFNTGMAIAQLDFDADRIKKHLSRKADELRTKSEEKS